jgi:hypothetical protein
MKRQVLLSLAIAVAGLSFAPQLVAQTGAAPAATVPPQLLPPVPAVSLLRATAQGSQIYVCGAKSGGGGFE